MSDLVAGGLWFPVGENDPDEYAQIPGFDGKRFDLVEHDGTYRGLRNALESALAAEQSRKGKPLMWVIDSGSRLWDLISGMAQHEMYQRLARKAAQQNRPAPDTEQKPAVDLWNVAADRWSYVMDALRAHNGPVVITARMELKAVMNGNGEPTRDKEQKILAHKSLPSEVDAIVELQGPGEAVITGVRSVKLAGVEARRDMHDFTVDKLLRALGVDHGVGTRTHSGIDPTDSQADEARTELGAWCDANTADRSQVAAQFADANGGLTIAEATAGEIRAFMASLPKKAAA